MFTMFINCSQNNKLFQRCSQNNNQLQKYEQIYNVHNSKKITYLNKLKKGKLKTTKKQNYKFKGVGFNTDPKTNATL